MTIPVETRDDVGRGGFTTIVRDVTNSIQAIPAPGGEYAHIEIEYQDAGSAAGGNLKLVPEAWSSLDAQGRMANDEQHYEIPLGGKLQFRYAPGGDFIYIQTTSAETGSNNVHIRSIAPVEVSSGLTASSRLLHWARTTGSSPTAVVTDQCGQGNDWAFMTDLAAAAAWANAGYITIDASAGTTRTGVELPKALFNDNVAIGTGGSILFFVRAKITAPGSTLGMLCTGRNNTVPGFLLSVYADGKCSIDLRMPGGVDNYGSKSDDVVADGTERTVAVLFDTTRLRAELFVDGAHQAGSSYDMNALWDIDAGHDIHLGGQAVSAALADSTSNLQGPVMQVSELAILAWPAGAPADVSDLVHQMDRSLFWRPTAKRVP